MFSHTINGADLTIFAFRGPTLQQIADLEDAARDFGVRMDRLRTLDVPPDALLRIYRTGCKMTGQTDLFDAVAELPRQFIDPTVTG